VAVGAAFYSRLSIPRRLEAAAAVVYGVVFVLLVVFSRPGLGLSQGFYLAIVLVALAGGPWTGAAAGLLAAVLLAGSELAGHKATVRTLWNTGLEVRLTSYVVAGAAVGYFAQRGRRMLAQSLHVLDDLLGLAQREVESGALTTTGFDGRVARRAKSEWPFGVLVGSLAVTTESAVTAAVRTIAGEVSADEDVARIGDRLAVIVSTTSPESARERAAAIEQALETAGIHATFGWAFHPQDGRDVVALFGAASERLQARRHALGEDAPLKVVTELRSRLA